MAFGSERVASSFVPRERLEASLADTNLYVYSADGGSGLNSVDYRELLGEVSPDVATVRVELQNGTARELSLVDQAFVYESHERATFPLRVVAYDESENVVASKDLPPPGAPG